MPTAGCCAHDGGGMGVAGVEHGVRFVGRAAELDVLRSALERAATGCAGVTLVDGEAGIGKSRLVTEALRLARGLGFRVFSGTCDEIEQDRPLRALSEALGIERGAPDVRRAELAHLLDVGALRPARMTREPRTADMGWVIVEGVVDVVEELASTGPIVLAVEDLQWADPLTVRSLRAIGRHLALLPLALFVTVRGGARPAGVDEAIADLLAHGAEQVRVGRLSPEEVVDLTGEVVGCPPGPRLVEQVTGAGGNPLFVIELLRAIDDEGAIDVSGGRAEARSVSLPPNLRLTLLRRLSLLPDDAVNLLRVASILGSTFSLTELALLSGRSAAQLVPALAAAIDAVLLTEVGDRLAFRHELVREAIYHDLPAAVRKGLHRQAGVVLGDAGTPIERVAGHVALGAERGDADAIGWLRQAARAVAGRAPATTVRLLERALELVDADDPVHDSIAAELVAPLLSSGRQRDAEAVARAALARGLAPEVEVMVRTDLAGVLSMGARYPEGIEQLELASVAAADDDRHQVLGAAGSVLMVLAGRLEGARAGAERAVEAGERLGNDHALCVGLQALAMVALAEGYVHRAVGIAQRAVAVADRGSGAWVSQVVPRLWLGTALADADRLSEAEGALEAGRRRAEQAGDVARLPLFHWAIAEARLAGGQWDDALAEAEAGLGLLEENAAHVGDVFAHAIRAHVALHRGDLTSAQSAVGEARCSLVAGGVEVGFEWMTWIDALLLEEQGDPARALALLERAWDLIAPVRYLQAASRAMGPDLVRLALAAGDQPRAVAVTEELERSARRSPTPSIQGLALRCRGLLAGDPGALLAAVAAHRAGPRPYPLAAACEDAAIALGRAGRLDRAVPLLQEAVTVYEGLEASWDVARVRSAQQGFGIRPSRRSRRRASFGWESLTPTEATVAALAAEGLTNRQIAERLYVSRRTVATHVEHLLQKLGLANRVEVAAEVIRRTINEQAPPQVPTAPESGQASRRRRSPAPPPD